MELSIFDDGCTDSPIIASYCQHSSSAVASTSPISTFFASTPQHAIQEGYLWSTLSSGEVFCPVVFEVQAPFVQQTTPIPQTGLPFPQAAMTYSSPLIHTTQQNHGPIFHGESVKAYDKVDNLQDKYNEIQREMKALNGKELFGKNAYDFCLVPNVVIPLKFKVSDFEKYKRNTFPKIHLVTYVRKMSAQDDNDELFTHYF